MERTVVFFVFLFFCGRRPSAFVCNVCAINYGADLPFEFGATDWECRLLGIIRAQEEGGILSTKALAVK